MNKSTSMVFKLISGTGRSRTGQVFFLNATRQSKYFSSQAPSTSSEGPSGTGSNESNAAFTSTTSDTDAQEGQRATISKAMHAYLKRAKDHQEFMDKQEKEFVFGRRHLANMMGKDPESFTQRDIDESIRYLFPSGLYEPRARPLMKPPKEVYPKQKSAEFDISGRPHHPFFYTSSPNFYYLLHEMVGKLNSLNKLAPSKSVLTLEDSALAGSVWLSKPELEEKLLEKLNDNMYEEWKTCFERLVAHPKRDREIEFINSWRKPLAKQTKADELPPITLEPDGRKSVHIPYCMKKTARADVLLTVPGTGEFKINGKGLEYFTLIQNRESVIAPLQLVGWLGKVDVEVNCEGGKDNEVIENPGESVQASAVRWGIATGLAALGADQEALRLAGYLIRDYRQRERTKVGMVGPRAKWTWKKR